MLYTCHTQNNFSRNFQHDDYKRAEIKTRVGFQVEGLRVLFFLFSRNEIWCLFLELSYVGNQWSMFSWEWNLASILGTQLCREPVIDVFHLYVAKYLRVPNLCAFFSHDPTIYQQKIRAEKFDSRAQKLILSAKMCSTGEIIFARQTLYVEKWSTLAIDCGIDRPGSDSEDGKGVERKYQWQLEG